MSRPPDPDALREAARALVDEYRHPDGPYDREMKDRILALEAALAAPAAPPPEGDTDDHARADGRVGAGVDGPARGNGAAPSRGLACEAPDPVGLAALLHPWTCSEHGKEYHRHIEGGGWLCQRAAADIAFRLGQKELPYPDHADMSVDARRDAS